MGKKCKYCGRPYSGPPVCPSSWGFIRRESIAHCTPDAIGARCYCSEKCRAEAEAGNGGGGGSEDESGGGSSSSDSGSGGCLSNILAGVVLFLLLAVVYGIFFHKKEDANDPAVKMAKWEEHLEKRRAAFAEGLPEEGVEARGLKNYTWEEWQARQKNANEKSNEKEVKKETKSLADLWLEHQNKRGELLNQGVSSDAVDKMGYEALALDDFKARYKDKDAEAELKKLNAQAAELIKERKNASLQPVASAPVNSTARNEAAEREKTAVEVSARAEAKMKSEARAKVRAEYEAKAKAEANIRAKAEAEARAKAEAEARAKAEAEARAKAEAEAKAARAKAEAEARAKAEAEARAKAEAEAKAARAKAEAEARAKAEAAGAVGGQQNGTSKKASKDSKSISIIVQGQGNTKESALHYAFCSAVWNTIGTWVGSRTRIQEHRDQVVALVKTVTEADIRKFEVLDTQQQDGKIVVKVKVVVSKKQIAPKFAKVFPDVFTIDEKTKDSRGAPQPQVGVRAQPSATATGHYETRVQNVWVEGRYINQTTPQGRTMRTWQPGHYEQRQTQVWVTP